MDAYEKVTNRIITMLKEGTIPWEQPWIGGSGSSSGSSGGSSTTSSVKTGDETPIATYVLLMLIALGALTGAGAYTRRRRRAEK